MASQSYDPKVKAAFTAAAKAAMKSGKGKAGALQAAKDAGYMGGAAGLKKVLYAPAKKGKKGRKVKTTAVAPVVAAPKATPTAVPVEKKGGRKIYDPKIKAAFMAAAQDARKAGKTWVEAFVEAKKVGYTGTVGSLPQLFIAKGAKGKKARTAAKTATPTPVAAPSATVGKMGGQRGYDPKVKAAFMAAARDARAAGKGWAEAHQAAKAAGYGGSVSGLVQQFIANKGKKKAKPAPVKAVKVVAAPKAAKSPSGLGSLEAAIDRIVAERVEAAIGKAIEALRAAVE